MMPPRETPDTPENDVFKTSILLDTGMAMQAPQEEPSVPKADEAPVPASLPVSEAVKSLSNEEVTGHTAALWKYYPVPEEEPEPHSEYQTQTRTVGGMTVWGARVRGKKHKHEGTNCDDWFTIGQADDCLLLAVSDGAGSKKLSRIGAQVACKTAIDALETSVPAAREQFPGLNDALGSEMTAPAFQTCCGLLAKAMQDAVCAAWDAVEDAAKERAQDEAFTALLGRPTERTDLSATLLVALVVPVTVAGQPECLVVTCQIGDGLIALLDTNAPFASAVKLLCEPDSGDFAGETDFLTAKKMRQPEQLMPRTRISRSAAPYLFLMTDGVADDYYPSDPQLCRLYLDLLVNGVLDCDAPAPRLTDRMLRCIADAPEPVAYPWVNDPEKTLALHAMKLICEAESLPPEEAWELQGMWAHAAAIRRPLREIAAPEERLRQWLDHYVERGSFDDRTLLAVRLRTGGEAS